MFLNTKRIELHEFKNNDHQFIKELDSDPEVMRYISNGIPSDDNEVSRAISIFIEWTKKKNGKYGYWKAVEKDSRNFIGWFHLRPLKSESDNFDKLEIGYRLKQSVWGKGFATEVSKKLIQYAINDLAVKEIWALAMKKNIASQRVMQKCGLKLQREDTFDDFPGVDKSSVWFKIEVPILRKVERLDIEKVMECHRRSIREICVKDYSHDQIQKWSNINYSMDIWKNTVERDCCYVYERDDKILGFCHAMLRENEVGEIVGMYFVPEIQGLGLGRKIFNLCIDYLKENNVKKVIIHGTKTAKAFYESMGFNCLGKKEVNIRGAIIESYDFEKKI